MENEDVIDIVNDLLNPKEDNAESKLSTLKKIYKKIIIEDLKGKGFEFTGKFTLEIKGDSLIVKATK